MQIAVQRLSYMIAISNSGEPKKVLEKNYAIELRIGAEQPSIEGQRARMEAYAIRSEIEERNRQQGE